MSLFYVWLMGCFTGTGFGMLVVFTAFRIDEARKRRETKP